jgi:hypothetical protein
MKATRERCRGIIKARKSQFVFYPPIFVYGLLTSYSRSIPFGYYLFRARARRSMGFSWATPAFYESPVDWPSGAEDELRARWDTSQPRKCQPSLIERLRQRLEACHSREARPWQEEPTFPSHNSCSEFEGVNWKNGASFLV